MIRKGLRFWVWGFGFGVVGFGFWGLGFWGSGLRVLGFGSRVQGLGDYGAELGWWVLALPLAKFPVLELCDVTTRLKWAVPAFISDVGLRNSAEKAP